MRPLPRKTCSMPLFMLYSCIPAKKQPNAGCCQRLKPAKSIAKQSPRSFKQKFFTGRIAAHLFLNPAVIGIQADKSISPKALQAGFPTQQRIQDQRGQFFAIMPGKPAAIEQRGLDYLHIPLCQGLAVCLYHPGAFLFIFFQQRWGKMVGVVYDNAVH